MKLRDQCKQLRVIGGLAYISLRQITVKSPGLSTDDNRHLSRGSKLKYISMQEHDDREVTSSTSSLVTDFMRGFVSMGK